MISDLSRKMHKLNCIVLPPETPSDCLILLEVLADCFETEQENVANLHLESQKECREYEASTHVLEQAISFQSTRNMYSAPWQM